MFDISCIYYTKVYLYNILDTTGLRNSGAPAMVNLDDDNDGKNILLVLYIP